MRTSSKRRVQRQHTSMVEALEPRQLMASSFGYNDNNMVWDTGGVWYNSDITIFDAPVGAVATSAYLTWKVDAEDIGMLEMQLTGPGGYNSAGYYLPYTGGDVFSGYRQTSEGEGLITLPGTTPVNGTWSFNIMDYDDWFGMGRVDYWTITINYTTSGTGASEIGVSGGGYSITDGDSTPSTSDGTNFGVAALGGSTISKTFRVNNTGTAALTLGSVSVPSGFTITQNLPSSIAAGGSADLIVRLNTNSIGTFAGDISFTTNDADESPFNFRITGTVQATGNQAPTDITLSSTSVSENRMGFTTIGYFGTTDPNPGDTYFTYALVSGTGSTDNGYFMIMSGATLVTATSFDYEARSSCSIRVRTTDQGGLSFDKVFTISIIDIDEVAPTVTAISINDGAAQRSMVKKIAVTFSEPVTVAPDAMSIKLSTGAVVPGTTISTSNPSGDQRTYVVSFSGSGAATGSLADGIYDLTIINPSVRDLASNILTGSYTQRFHRLFGDVDGNRIVNAIDYARLRTTFARSSGDPLFNTGFDYDSNNLINALDLAQFRRRFGMVYSY